MTDKTRVQLTQVQETLFNTLYAKALDHRSKHPILNDEKADQLVNLIDYDLKKLKSFGNDNVIVVRAKQYDEWLKEFLKENPDAVVLNLGCGLDTRITRIDPPVGVRWFDIDYPEVIKLRERFYSNSDSYTMIGSSITNPNWLTEITQDKPTIVIAEGVLAYLTEDEVKALLNRLTDHFLHGQIAFDIMNAYAITAVRSRLGQTTGASQMWAVEDLEQVDKLDSKLERVTEMPLFRSPYIKKLPWAFRWFYSLLSVVPQYRNMMRLVRYQF